MPDITAPRPVSGEPIQTAWGTQVHDMLEGVQAGKVDVTVTAAASGTAAVTFPRGHSAPPIVVVTPQAGNSAWYAVVTIVSATSFTVMLVRRDGASSTVTMSVGWISVGPLV